MLPPFPRALASGKSELSRLKVHTGGFSFTLHGNCGQASSPLPFALGAGLAPGLAATLAAKES